MKSQICPFCGAEIERSPEIRIESTIQLKVPLVSLILSTFFPGLGQVYNGDSLNKGLLLIFGCIFGSFFFLVPGLLIWIYGMYDAYSVADKINKGIYEYKMTQTKDIILIIMIPLVAMIILMFISLYAAMQILGSLSGIFPDTEYLLSPDNYNIANYRDFSP